MAEYSKEWVEKRGYEIGSDFSIASLFKKLEEGQYIDVICEGFGVTKIINDNNVCFLEVKGKVVSYEDLVGKKLDS